jgi:hypothetical protein
MPSIDHEIPIQGSPMQNDMCLEIILLPEDESLAYELEKLSDGAFVRASAGFDGLDTIIVAFTTLSVPAINTLGRIVVEHIRSRKHIKIRYGKTVVEGISEDKVVELLELLRHDAKK